MPGNAPPVNLPTPPQIGLSTGGGEVGASAGIDFPPSPKASICGINFALPRFKIGFKLPAIPFPPPIPIPHISLKLKCKLPNPIDITAGIDVPYGGGRSYTASVDPDLNESTP